MTLPVRQALLGVARGAVVCEEVVEDAQLDGLRARPVQKVMHAFEPTIDNAISDVVVIGGAGDEVDSSEVGFDMDVGMDVDGAAGQSVGSSRGVRGLVAAAADSPRPGSATATGKQELLRRHHIHRLSFFRTST
ncbi:hypothetical protein PI125_g24807 [Phytophthora idaei]|nr:hypothetical protein PI125_g24807 [Phytophthora idaei]